MRDDRAVGVAQLGVGARRHDDGGPAARGPPSPPGPWPGGRRPPSSAGLLVAAGRSRTATEAAQLVVEPLVLRARVERVGGDAEHGQADGRPAPRARGRGGGGASCRGHPAPTAASLGRAGSGIAGSAWEFPRETAVCGSGREPAATLPPWPDPTGRSRCVLVVDDEEHITELVAMGLGFNGFEVERAASGRAALDAVERRRPDLVVLDVMLPDLDGFEVARRLRQAEGAGTRVPDHLPHRPRHHRGQGRGPAPRQRRLRHQAVQHRGAHRAGEGRAAALDGRRAGRAPPDLRRPRARRGHPRRVAGRPARSS